MKMCISHTHERQGGISIIVPIRPGGNRNDLEVKAEDWGYAYTYPCLCHQYFWQKTGATLLDYMQVQACLTGPHSRGVRSGAYLM